MKRFVVAIGACLLSFPALALTASPTAPSIEIFPPKPTQGDPLIIKIYGEGVSLESVAKIRFNGKLLWFFPDNSDKKVPTAFYGIDLNHKAGSFAVSVEMENGKIYGKTVEISPRKKYEATLAIPEKLGGNTKEAASKLVLDLSKENAVINSVFSAGKRYWRESFIYPLDSAEITDEYGYSRNTVQYTIPHKGADFRANEGTPVRAINGGIVRLARFLPTYGNTVAIDHGLGLVSYYMHLSKIGIKEGRPAQAGQTIGLSGSTGYATGAHLHLSVKIYGVSIDPIVFLELSK